MILECPSCRARYMVPNGLFVGGARQVRCARCKHEWQASPSNNIDIVAPPPVTSAAAPPAPEIEKPQTVPRPAPAHKEEQEKGEPVKAPALEQEAAETHDDPPPPDAPIANLPAIIKKFNWKKRAAYAVGGFALLFILLAWPILDRQHIVKAFPALRGLYEGIGLAIPKTGEGLVFDKVSSELRYDSGTMKLFVDGVIHNTTDETQFIPDIKAAARGADQAVIQSWWVDAPAATIEAGGEVPFHTEIGATTQKTIEDVYLEFTAKDEKPNAGQ